MKTKNPATMTPRELKTARHRLGLTQEQLGRLLDTDKQSVYRMELEPGRLTHRKPPPRYVKLLTAYLEGYRPKDWPKEE